MFLTINLLGAKYVITVRHIDIRGIITEWFSQIVRRMDTNQ